jgi:hypothetical protein
VRKTSVIGIPWYRDEDFPELRSMFADGALLHETFAAWLAAATATERRLRTRWTDTVRVEIRPAEFRAWCATRGLALTASARGEFANDTARAWRDEKMRAEWQGRSGK